MSKFLFSAFLTLTLFHQTLANLVYVDQNEKDWYVRPLAEMMKQKGLTFDQKGFVNHGCWCGLHHGGKTMSPLDDLCHQLSQCIKCVDLEKSCSAVDNFWIMNFPEHKNLTEADNSELCFQDEGQNLDSCSTMKCECAEHVLKKIVFYLEKKSSELGEAECPVDEVKKENNLVTLQLNSVPDIMLKKAGRGGRMGPGVGSAANDACCGTHPHWFPYNTKSGQRSCCGEKTYNAYMLKCCPDGSMVSMGSICEEQAPITGSLIENVIDIVAADFTPEPKRSRMPVCSDDEDMEREDGKFVCKKQSLDSCLSTDQCFSTVPKCSNGQQKLVSYKFDDCCSHFYCVPFSHTQRCEEMKCENDKNQSCGQYQQATTSLESLSDCCSEVECVCDYQKCPDIPKCGKDQVLLAQRSEDGCCKEYECLKRE